MRASLPTVQIGVMGATGPAGQAVSVQFAGIGIDVIMGSRSEERAAEVVAALEEKWRGREALVLANDIVRLVTLTGGGHIAEFRFREQSGLPTLNPFWVPPWKTIEPYRYRSKRHLSRYGSPATGRVRRSRSDASDHTRWRKHYSSG